MQTMNRGHLCGFWWAQGISLGILFFTVSLIFTTAWAAAHNLTSTTCLSGGRFSLASLARLSALVSAGCIVATLLLQSGGNVTSKAVLLVEAAILTLALWTIPVQSILAWQRSVFVGSLARRLTQKDVIRDVNAWRLASLDQLTKRHLTQSQETKMLLPGSVYHLFPGKHLSTNVGKVNDGGQSACWGLIAFSDGGQNWGIRFGDTNVLFGWRKETTAPITADYYAFIGFLEE